MIRTFRRRNARRSQGQTFQFERLEWRALLSTVVVNSTQDLLFPSSTKTVSLRNAIAVANHSSTPTTILFDALAFGHKTTITLTGGQFELLGTAKPVTIQGPGANLLTINGNDKSRIFLIDHGAQLGLSGVTLTRGNVISPTDTASSPLSRSAGGAIRNNGTLTLTNALLTGNHAGLGGGGAISNFGTLIASNCTFSNNRADTPVFAIGGDGGAIDQEGTATLINDTIANNAVNNSSYGGGINVGENNVKLDLTNVTITGNTASSDFNGGGGLALPFNAAGKVYVGNSIIAGNKLVNNASTVGVDVKYATLPPRTGTLISRGHNLIGKTDGSQDAGLVWLGTDRTGTAAHPLDPQVGALANNGGPTPTVLPRSTSPAVNGGSNALVPSNVKTDQRGLFRIVGSAVDIGAVETQTTSRQISRFVLVDADTNQDVLTLFDGAYVDLHALPRRLNVRADNTGSTVSVRFTLDNATTRLEQANPFALFSDWNGDYHFGDFTDGPHTLAAQAFANGNGTSAPGPVAALHVNIVNQPPTPTTTVKSLALYDKLTGTTLRTLKDFDTIDLSKLPATVGIRAFTTGSPGSVQYALDTHIGASPSDALTVGRHTLTALPFTGPGATGTRGASLQLRLYVINGPTVGTVFSSTAIDDAWHPVIQNLATLIAPMANAG